MPSGVEVAFVKFILFCCNLALTLSHLFFDRSISGVVFLLIGISVIFLSILFSSFLIYSFIKFIKPIFLMFTSYFFKDDEFVTFFPFSFSVLLDDSLYSISISELDSSF